MRTVSREHIRGTRGRVPCAEFGCITLCVARRPADLSAWCETALGGAAWTTLRVADRIILELARIDIAAIGGSPLARIAILACFDNAVPAHLEGNNLARWIWIHEAAAVQL